MFRFRTLTALRHAVSTRHGGVSPSPYESLNVGYGTPDLEENVARNRRILLDTLGVRSHEFVAGRLVHGNQVSKFRRRYPERHPIEKLRVREGSDRLERFFPSDGVVSDVPGLHFLLTYADCVPLLLYDPARGVLGAAHAGWRGTALRMGPALVRAMVDAFGSNPADILAGIGPSVGPCCYSVGPEVTDTFSRQQSEPVLERRHGTVFLDLWATNEEQLRGSGISSIEQAHICTSCNTDTYFSHRAEAGLTGRFALVAGLPSALPAL